jgi:hypothetical protein
VYTVRLTGYNDSNPAGVSASVVVSVSPAVYYVDAASLNPSFPYCTWQTAASTIQDAVDASTLPGRLVLVTNGVYGSGAIEWGGTNRIAMTNPVVVESVNGARVTTIRGDTNGVRCAWVGNGAILSGFTLTQGRSAAGGGAWCQGWGVVSNCVFTGNSVTNYGGGVYAGTLYGCTLSGNSAFDGGAAAVSTLYDCVLSSNSANGGGGAAESTLFGCTLTGNSATAGGGASGGSLSNCVVTRNLATASGGGVYYATLYNCGLASNSAAIEGGGSYGGVLRNCTLAGNAAFGGGGSGYDDLYNCTVTGNSAGSYGGGVTGSLLYNCLVYFNRAPQGSNYEGGTFTYCCTAPLAPGAGNIAADPQLAGAFYLSAGSPCIGAGSPDYASGVDIDGEPWANPPAIGADQPGPANGPLTMEIQVNYTNVAPGYAVAFSELDSGQISRSVWDFGDGTVVANEPFPLHAWSAPGVYTIQLRGYNGSNPTGVLATFVVTVSEAVYYADASSPNPSFPYGTWLTAARSIQAAVAAGNLPGRLVLVTNGVYYGGVVLLDGPTRVALTNSVVVRSVNGPHATLIEGQGRVRCAWVGNEASLSGFSLMHGGALGEYEMAKGGGVYAEPLATLTNCVISGSRASEVGGGAYGGTLYNCTLATNSTYDGGGAFNSTLYNCIVTGNSATNYGGGAHSGALYNCILVGNQAFEGGGALGAGLYNCTVTGNFATNYGGGTLSDWVWNSIVYFNQAPLYPNSGGDSFEYSCTTPPAPGAGNISADPRFVNAAAGDFRLRPDSPCIDAGTNLVDLLTTDIQGLPRVMDGNEDGIAVVDMGAYEFNPYRFEPALTLSTNGFQFIIQGEPGKQVRIEASRDLLTWELLAIVPIPTGGQSLIDPAATTEPFRFYRAIALR